jgi:hypothetical protein
MSSIDKLSMKIKDLERTSKVHDENINLCYDLIEGIHILFDQELGTNLKEKTPPHLKGKSRKKGKTRKRGKTQKRRKSSRKGLSRRVRGGGNGSEDGADDVERGGSPREMATIKILETCIKIYNTSKAEYENYTRHYSRYMENQGAIAEALKHMPQDKMEPEFWPFEEHGDQVASALKDILKCDICISIYNIALEEHRRDEEGPVMRAWLKKHGGEDIVSQERGIWYKKAIEIAKSKRLNVHDAITEAAPVAREEIMKVAPHFTHEIMAEALAMIGYAGHNLGVGEK